MAMKSASFPPSPAEFDFQKSRLFMKRAVDLIFPKNLIKSPVIYEMCKEVPVVFNIRRAKVNEKVGEIILELEGGERDLDDATDYLKKRGIRVEPITHDTFES